MDEPRQANYIGSEAILAGILQADLAPRASSCFDAYLLCCHPCIHEAQLTMSRNALWLVEYC